MSNWIFRPGSEQVANLQIFEIPVLLFLYRIIIFIKDIGLLNRYFYKRLPLLNRYFYKNVSLLNRYSYKRLPYVGFNDILFKVSTEYGL